MTDQIIVPASLVPYLRSGAIAAFGSALDLLTFEVEHTPPEPRAFAAALALFDEARSAIDTIGVTQRRLEGDVAVDPAKAPFVVRALRAVYGEETRRLDDAATDGVHLDSPPLPELQLLISQLAAIADPTRRGELELGRLSMKWKPRIVQRRMRTERPRDE